MLELLGRSPRVAVTGRAAANDMDMPRWSVMRLTRGTRPRRKLSPESPSDGPGWYPFNATGDGDLHDSGKVRLEAVLGQMRRFLLRTRS